MGKSGSGKTTLLKCVYGLEEVSQGEVRFDGEKVYGRSRNIIPGHKDMKLVSQDYYVLDYHTVEENINDKLVGLALDVRARKVNQLLRLLDLTRLKNVKASVLSAGQKQRVSIARALADFPKLLLLDEPFSNLDFALKDGIIAYIRRELKKNRSACILVTHQPEEALRYAKEILVLDQGRLIYKGNPENIYHHAPSTKVGGIFGKVFELKKEDFLQAKGIKFGRKKSIILRPEYIQTVSKKEQAHLHAKVLDVFFCGDHFEYIAETKESEKQIAWNEAVNKYKDGDFVYLKINQPN